MFTKSTSFFFSKPYIYKYISNRKVYKWGLLELFMKNSLSNNEAQKILDESQGLTFEEQEDKKIITELNLSKVLTKWN